MKRALIVSIALLVLVAAGLGAVAWWAMLPTKGPSIPYYGSPRRALLVVDLQEDYVGPAARWPVPGRERLLTAANALIDAAGPLGVEVIYIRNEVAPANLLARAFSMNTGVRGTPGARLDGRLHRAAGAAEFTKNVPDAFSNPDLDAHLRQRAIGSLTIVGVDPARCVGATARGALNRGYDVALVRDAVATASGTPLEALLGQLVAEGASVVSLPEAMLAPATAAQ